MYVGTFIVVALVAFLLLGNPTTAKQIWTMFAAANQLLAALTLLAATLWFSRNSKPCWITAIPMALMLSVSSWALATIFAKSVSSGDGIRMGASLFLLALAAVVVTLGVREGINTWKKK